MLFNLTMFPIGAGDALSRPVSEVIDEIGHSGLPHTVTGASTLIEGEWDRVMPIIHRSFSKLRGKHERVYMVLTVDDHTGVPDRIHEAIEDVERELGHAVPH